MVGSLRVPSGRFARGTVLIARHSPRLEFLCKAEQPSKKRLFLANGRTSRTSRSSIVGERGKGENR